MLVVYPGPCSRIYKLKINTDGSFAKYLLLLPLILLFIIFLISSFPSPVLR